MITLLSVLFRDSFITTLSLPLYTNKLLNVIVWMFYDRTLSHRLNHIHERALRFAYKDYQTDFESLLEQRNLVSIHVKNLQLLIFSLRGILLTI